MTYVNDYELLYLIQTEKDVVALEYLAKKYERLIWRYIKQYNVPFGSEDDYFQEGIITLHKAALNFQESYGKTFTRYFELILKRRFWALLKQEYKYVVCEQINEIYPAHQNVEQNFLLEEAEDNFVAALATFSPLEQQVYNLYYEEHQSINLIAAKLKCKVNSIYNAIYRIKSKIKQG